MRWTILITQLVERGPRLTALLGWTQPDDRMACVAAVVAGITARSRGLRRTRAEQEASVSHSLCVMTEKEKLEARLRLARREAEA